jgi:hypothetical protein
MIKYQEISCGGRLKRNESIIKDIYINIVTDVRACENESDVFPIKI